MELCTRINVVSWLGARFAIVPFSILFWIYAVIGKLAIVARHLARQCLRPKNVCVKRLWTFLLKQYCLSPYPKRIRLPIKPLLKNSFSTHFQGTGPWEGPVHFSRLVLRVHNCSKLFHGWSWSQEKKEKHRKAFYTSNSKVQSARLSQKNQTAY